MPVVSLFDAERSEADGWRTLVVEAGTRVSIGGGWIVTVSQKAIDCDCGKGIDCPSNSRQRGGND